MMKNDSSDLLNDLLMAWHKWAQGYQHSAGINSSPMFRDARTSRGWDSVADIVDSEIDGGRMESVNFHIMDMPPIQRTALQLNARNLVTGKAVWRSPRLPESAEERAVILMEARNALMKRLLAAGVI